MDIKQLTDIVYEDLNPVITKVCFAAEHNIALTLECDDWQGGADRRKFLLLCDLVRESTITVGDAGYLDFCDDHPVLQGHKGPQGELYFSSAPVFPESVFFKAHDILGKYLKDWLDPSTFLNGSPENLKKYLLSGNGLLARGPFGPLEALAKGLSNELRLNLVPTVTLHEAWKALIIDSSWMICKTVHVQEIND
ncbi:hypothetical protein EV700_1068 [Fluviicoccus keumensis]|uniref:Uncharacterized protein n=1 Tax=Fluviicoccus keumensis TaxID=1435465 RepID=A0A4V2G6B2_9GAMM|nr:hypothetical protein [Fluviicoccus keumensis]RZU48096.1 hypothetical protein EV700_1068 [Fluviicoccus keumensis]